MKKRDLAKKKSEKDTFYCSGYKRIRNKVTYGFRKRVQEYYDNLADETQNNPKAMWKTINKVLHKNSNHMVTQKIFSTAQNVKHLYKFRKLSTKISKPLGQSWQTKILHDQQMEYIKG